MEREPGETANDRNDRAIRTAALWYQHHLDAEVKGQHGRVRVVLLTNDKANREKAVEEGIVAYTGERIHTQTPVLSGPWVINCSSLCL